MKDTSLTCCLSHRPLHTWAPHVNSAGALCLLEESLGVMHTPSKHSRDVSNMHACARFVVIISQAEFAFYLYGRLRGLFPNLLSLQK